MLYGVDEHGVGTDRTTKPGIAGNRRHRGKARVHCAKDADQHDRDQRIGSSGPGTVGHGVGRPASAGHLVQDLGSRADGIRNAGTDLHRRRVADRGLLSGRCDTDARRHGAERQDRDRPEPLRSEPRRGAARTAGHLVRRGIDGRYDQTRDQST